MSTLFELHSDRAFMVLKALWSLFYSPNRLWTSGAILGAYRSLLCSNPWAMTKLSYTCRIFVADNLHVLLCTSAEILSKLLSHS